MSSFFLVLKISVGALTEPLGGSGEFYPCSHTVALIQIIPVLYVFLSPANNHSEGWGGEAA